MENVSKQISIHALREEGDGVVLAYAIKSLVISIHALREEGDVVDLWYTRCA